MALGCAHMLGYKLTINFRMPYLAVNVSEFWRRWHISLSTWLRDYLFIPLGGSRGSGWMTARNLMITMTLGGLWHGANWTFVLWGVIHGVLLVSHRRFQAFADERPFLRDSLQTWVGTAFRISLTFFCVMVCWVFFQPSLPKALAILERMFSPFEGIGFPMTKGRFWFCLGMMATWTCDDGTRVVETTGSTLSCPRPGVWICHDVGDESASVARYQQGVYLFQF